MDELISKQDAIEAINVWLYCDKDERMPADVIKSLPPVQPTYEIIHCENCEHWDTSWETAYGLHYCPMIDMATKKNFFCKYGAEKRGAEDGQN